jgi:tetratricopeptide (TPR) repeat protein
MAADLGHEASQVQKSWDEANFGSSGDQRKEAMLGLVEECKDLTSAHADDAEILTWCGIANSSYAGMASALSAMKYAKAARSDLERAIELDPTALSGAAQTSLGTLYFKVPGWPIGFGDEDKARELLQTGLKANPNGMDSNFFYADFLLDNDQPAEAARYLEKALAAPARPNRALADKGRTEQIQAMMAKIEQGK